MIDEKKVPVKLAVPQKEEPKKKVFLNHFVNIFSYFIQILVNILFRTKLCIFCRDVDPDPH